MQTESNTLRARSQQEVFQPAGQLLLVRVGHKVRQRLIEWLAALQLTGLGIVLLYPSQTFNSSPSYVPMSQLASENLWGFFLLITGFAGLAGLFINGAMAKVTPWIRVVRACVGALTFSLIFIGFVVAWLGNGLSPSTAIPVYFVIALGEFLSVHYAMTDARVSLNGPDSKKQGK